MQGAGAKCRATSRSERPKRSSSQPSCVPTLSGRGWPTNYPPILWLVPAGFAGSRRPHCRGCAWSRSLTIADVLIGSGRRPQPASSREPTAVGAESRCGTSPGLGRSPPCRPLRRRTAPKKTLRRQRRCSGNGLQAGLAPSLPAARPPSSRAIANRYLVVLLCRLVRRKRVRLQVGASDALWCASEPRLDN